MAANTYDVIVIGAGHNGLVTSTYLAKAGQKVLLVEAGEQPGGAAQTREFAKGYRASAVAHLLHALHPKIIADLNLTNHGLRIAEKAIGTSAMLPGGTRLDLTADKAATQASIAKFSQADSLAYHPRMERLVRLAGALGSFLLRTPPSPSPSSNDFQTKLALGMFALKLRMMGKKDMLELSRILTINVADLANDFFESDILKGLLGFEATLGVYLGPRSPNTVFNLLYRLASMDAKHGQGGHYLPQGGMGAVIDALVKAAKAAGVTIRTQAPVGRILIEKEQAVGVVLASGEEIRAPIVASSADPQRTLLHLVEPGNLDTEFLKRMRHLRMNGCVAKVHLALDGLPDVFRNAQGRMVFAPSTNYVEHAFDCAKYGRVADNPALEIVVPTLTDASLAPSGKHVLSILSQYAPYKLRTTTAEEARTQILDRTLNVLEQIAPGIRGLVTASEVLTPHDLEAQFNLSGGQWHQGEVTLDQVFFLRPAASFQQYKMPLPGLWLCGSGAHPGGNVSGAAGANAAREILKDLKNARKGAA
ncbi:phytoene desaturase family protein [Dongia sp.]|uniref:phytoene desaturase family protein n=1 Tax=Dongia sp. TaxID=1977262 RepID=UPI0035B1A28B